MNLISNKKLLLIDFLMAAGLTAFHLIFLNKVSTNPSEPGFYISVIFGISVVLLIRFLFNRTFFPAAKYISSKLLKKIDINFLSNEELIKEAGANRLLRREGVGGKLALTDKRLIFKSHQFNIQNHEEALNVIDIKNMNVFNILSLKNGLMVELYNDTVYKFIVKPGTPSKWIEEINKVRDLKISDGL